MEYKIGSKVRVKSNLKVNCRYGVYFVPSMEKFKNTVVTINSNINNTNFKIKEDNKRYTWNILMFDNILQIEDYEIY